MTRRGDALVVILAAVAAGCGDTTGAAPGADGGEVPVDAAPADALAPGGDLAIGMDLATGAADLPPIDFAAPPDLAVPCLAAGPTRGSAIALTPDDGRLVVANRDSGTVTVMSIDYTDGLPRMTVVAEIAVGGEPWQVVIDGCGRRAWVVLRRDQKVVRIDGLDGAPVKGPEVSVGSEPTGLALTPNGGRLYVANWVDGTVSVLDPQAMVVIGTVDLNSSLTGSGVLGAGASRPGLAHPRVVAISNNGDLDDNDETVWVTEWFGQRTTPDTADGKNADVNKQGMVYHFTVKDQIASTLKLPPVLDTGFRDSLGQTTGCFPNQVGAITLSGGFAWIASTCASPVGPLGVVQKGACTSTANCAAVNPASVCTGGLCTLSCTVDADCGFGAPAGICNLAAGGTCAPLTSGVKTTTHPAMSIVDVGGLTAATVVLDRLFDAKGSGRMPLLPAEVAFGQGGGFAYVAATGADAVFRLSVQNGAITGVGSPNQSFVDLRKSGSDPLVRLPVGVAAAATHAFLFVASEGSRDVTALDLNAQAIASSAPGDERITSATALPAPGTPGEAVLRGKRFFTTGLGRWSLRGEAWGSCAACHIDGLADGVTWFFARGPRQTISLDGSFASADPSDQRIFNWTAMFDEVADFEANVRGVSGGVGAIVSQVSAPPVNTDRINLAAQVPQQQGLQGSSNEVADPAGASPHPHSLIADWKDIAAWVRTIRSPRRPTILDPNDVAAGKRLFGTPALANCAGCHAGAKWTLSRVFYQPGDVPNAVPADPAPTSLGNIRWDGNLNGFPQALWPIAAPPADPNTSSRMRFGVGSGAEQLQCVLRPVGTIGPPVNNVPQGISDPTINVPELRQDMVTGAQGIADTGRGFNPPSLLGLAVGAPYFHAGNARTLEEMFSGRFQAHHQSAVAPLFAPNATEVRQLVAYLLSLDEDEPPLPLPALGAQGGDLCHYP